MVGRGAIAEHVWDAPFESMSNVIDVMIQRLRRKIDDPDGTSLITTRRGEGYMLARRSARRTRPIPRMMTLSIRARLTLWYSTVVVLVLVTGAVVGSLAQSRLALQRLDDDLGRTMATLEGRDANRVRRGTQPRSGRRRSQHRSGRARIAPWC